MMPMMFRNNSAIYLFSGKSAILMDCSEGTYGQIVDYCGDQAKVDAVVRKTRVLYITHLHGDHNLGLPRFLDERDKLLAEMPASERTTLYLLAPQCLLDWIEITGKRLAHPEHVCVIPHHIVCPQKYYRHQKMDFTRVQPLFDRE